MSVQGTRPSPIRPTAPAEVKPAENKPAAAPEAAATSEKPAARSLSADSFGAALPAAGRTVAAAGEAMLRPRTDRAEMRARLPQVQGTTATAAATLSATAPQKPLQAPGVPDAQAVAGNPNLRYLDLNREINKGYAQFANQLQSIVDPNFAATGKSSLNPVWFGFAPYASRGVGRGEMAAEAALKALQTYDGSSMTNVLSKAGVPESVARVAGPIIDRLPSLPGFPNAQHMRMAAAFAVAVASVSSNPGSMDAGNLGALLDPRTLAITAGRFVSLTATAPGNSFTEKLAAVGNTLRNALEDGNRRIYGDIGGAAQQFLNFRHAQSGQVTPDQVLDHFSLSQPATPGQARAMHDYALGHLNDSPQPTDFARTFPAPQFDSKNMVVAAFALYERAGKTDNVDKKNKMIAFANNMLAYREQHDAVQPAFAPGRVLPGEVDRRKLFEAMTPTVSLSLRSGTWKFDDYAERLPRRDWNPLTPRVTEYNWGEFNDRWTPILNAFEQGYKNRSAIWPMPSPDPNANL